MFDDQNFDTDCFNESDHPSFVSDLSSLADNNCSDEPQQPRRYQRTKSDPNGYESNERLFNLSYELETLNLALLALNFSDDERLIVLREYSKKALRFKNRVCTPSTDTEKTHLNVIKQRSYTKSNVRSDLPIGAYKSKNGRFISSINIPNGRTVYLGTFDTPEEAHCVFKKAHIEQHGVNSRYVNTGASNA